jgi:hypothetical protein
VVTGAVRRNDEIAPLTAPVTFEASDVIGRRAPESWEFRDSIPVEAIAGDVIRGQHGAIVEAFTAQAQTGGE